MIYRREIELGSYWVDWAGHVNALIKVLEHHVRGPSVDLEILEFGVLDGEVTDVQGHRLTFVGSELVADGRLYFPDRRATHLEPQVLRTYRSRFPEVST